ncbi:MAG TPA: hypothetical protein VMV10_01050 [Pirellulales bacterium]|nr:hypothetical protein [Pirellulales bacterium]
MHEAWPREIQGISRQGWAVYSGGLPFGAGGYAGPMFPGSITQHFNLSLPNIYSRENAVQILEAVESAARQRGYNMTGRGMIGAMPAAAARTMAYPR